jgi:hypothetical protein
MILAISVLLAFPVHATNKPPATPSTSASSEANAVGVGVGVGLAHSDSNSVSTAHSGDSTSNATVGDTTALGGESSASQEQFQSQEQSASADNAGNAQSVNINYRRNAPSIAQGSLMPAGCGAAGNAGGSQQGGAAFLGLAWTTHECYLLQYAAAYQAIGMVDFSCDLLRTSKTVQKALKQLGVEHPGCTTAENRQPVPAVVVLDQHSHQEKPEGTATHARVNEAIDRAFKRAVAK